MAGLNSFLHCSNCLSDVNTNYPDGLLQPDLVKELLLYGF